MALGLPATMSLWINVSTSPSLAVYFFVWMPGCLSLPLVHLYLPLRVTFLSVSVSLCLSNNPMCASLSSLTHLSSERTYTYRYKGWSECRPKDSVEIGIGAPGDSCAIAALCLNQQLVSKRHTWRFTVGRLADPKAWTRSWLECAVGIALSKGRNDT